MEKFSVHYHKKDMKRVWLAGYHEKDVILADGTKLHYAEGPENEKPPLLLIHGQTGSWESYAPVLPALAIAYHVFAIDCHGHGKSEKNIKKYTAKKMGADILWFIEHIIGEQVILSGHSSGGLLAGLIAAESPKQIKGLLLEDPPFFSTEKGERWENSFAYIDTYEPMHRFLHQLAGEKKETDWAIFYLKHARWMEFVPERPRKKTLDYAVNFRRRHPDKPLSFFFLPPSVNEIFATLDQYDLYFGESFYDSSWFTGFSQQDVLKRIQCPTVLIHTNWSYDENGILMGAMSGQDAMIVNQLIANCSIIRINSGHNSHFEKPEEFLSAMEKLKEKI